MCIRDSAHAAAGQRALIAHGVAVVVDRVAGLRGRQAGGHATGAGAHVGAIHRALGGACRGAWRARLAVDRRLAAGDHHRVAVAPAGLARRHRTLAGHTRGGRLRDHAAAPALAAVARVGLQIGTCGAAERLEGGAVGRGGRGVVRRVFVRAAAALGHGAAAVARGAAALGRSAAAGRAVVLDGLVSARVEREQQRERDLLRARAPPATRPGWCRAHRSSRRR